MRTEITFADRHSIAVIDADAYLAADAAYKELVEKAAHPTFEWTKDMMTEEAKLDLGLL